MMVYIDQHNLLPYWS